MPSNRTPRSAVFDRPASDRPVSERPDSNLSGSESAADRMRRRMWSEFVSQIGPRYAECSFETFTVHGSAAERTQQERVLAALRSYAKGIRDNLREGRNVVVFGPSGTGKDHLLVSLIRVAREVVSVEGGEARQKFRWANGMEVFSSLRDVFNAESRTEYGESRKWSSPPLLMLSDPLPPATGTSPGELTPFQAAFLLRVIDARYRACRPTFVSINVAGGKEAATRLGAAVLDRMKHDALTCWCNWSSFRKASEEV
jgi:DNA replication protein DnaC